MATSNDAYVFGPFRLDPARAQLMRDGVPITLSARAFQVLHLLARRAGGIVTREELLAEVWRGVTVEENNLTVQVSALRRALGETQGNASLIITVPNQGYRLAGPVHRESAPGPPDAPAAPATASAPPLRAASRRLPWASVAAAAICAACAVFWVRAHTPQSVAITQQVAAPRMSLVVLPFRNLGDDKRDDSLADAISDDLTTDLAHIPASVVIARESADSYKGRAVPTDQIGRALNVRYILEGSLRAAGDRRFINGQLIEAASGQHLWADRFDVPGTPLDLAQMQIVRRLSSALGATLPQIEAARSLRERPENPDTLDLFLRSRAQFMREESLQSMLAARAPLLRAIATDPDYVDALAELGWQLASMNVEFNRFATGADLAMARQVTAHALELDRNNPASLAATGAVQLADGNATAAESSFQAAIAIDPNNARAWFGLYLAAFATANWQNAYDRIVHLQDIDPASPNARYHKVYQGYVTLLLGHPAAAVSLMQQGEAGFEYPVAGMATWDDIGSDWLFLTAAYVMSGDVPRGRNEYAAIATVWPNRSAFRVASYFTKAEMQDPAIGRLFAALRQAGLPAFADEHHDDGVPPAATPQQHDDFAPTPIKIDGIPTIATPELAALLRARPDTVLIDMGMRAARPPGAIDGTFDPMSPASARRFTADLSALIGPLGTRAVVVLGDGTYGWRSCNAALQLRAAGIGNLLWYRGGEEAWARAGLPADDARVP